MLRYSVFPFLDKNNSIDVNYDTQKNSSRREKFMASVPLASSGFDDSLVGEQENGSYTSISDKNIPTFYTVSEHLVLIQKRTLGNELFWHFC